MEDIVMEKYSEFLQKWFDGIDNEIFFWNNFYATKSVI
jgi:hypothetical protein